jgi:hypothetical protein
MGIEAVQPDSELDEDNFQEEDSQYNFRELYDMVLSAKDNDIIFTVMPDEVDALKSGLIKRKSKDNIKMKDSGLTIDNRVLSFLVYESKKNPEAVDVRVHLRPRKGVKILDVAIPDDL